MAHLGHVMDLEGRILDEVLFILFPRPESYTGDDVVEISCHGSPVVAQALVELFLNEGLRLAEPGEFTLRAVLNGKMDLVQAEAVQDLIESKTDLQARVAANLIHGRLSRALKSARQELLEVVCQLETGLEFVEDDLLLASPGEVARRLEAVNRELEKLEISFQGGQVTRDGILAVLTGKPNVGKSSIFNMLTGRDGAIVTPVPGTTRDALRETVAMDGIAVTLVDTAGIRDERIESVEAFGVERSLNYLAESDLILFVVDRSTDFDDEDERIWREIGNKPYLILVNKIDLPASMELPDCVVSHSLGRVELSALQHQNLEELRSAIAEQAIPDSKPEAERPTLTRLRHKKCVEKARQELQSGLNVYLSGQGDELVLFYLRSSLGALGELTGEVTTEEILSEVFSSFCIGK
jgi:tRNA modification GTPase